MFRDSWGPDIVVGIDFGMTCTGVAYSSAPEWSEPRQIQHWPGRLGHELRNKVNTSVSYDLKTGTPNKWGFLCDPDDEDSEFNELFKLYLDPHYEDTSGLAPSIDQAQKWFRDYMQALHKFINEFFTRSMPRFEAKKVEYVFSVPTTWKDPALIAAMEKLIKQAGFGQTAKERASIYLTEAEAAAVYATQRMVKDEVFLVCDAGGGTTDLNVLKVASDMTAHLELTPLSYTEGIAVGSTLIDYKARQVLIDKLRPIQDQIPGDIEAIVTKMIDDQFQTFKCSFGVEGFYGINLYLPIPGMAPSVNMPQHGIENSKLVMTNRELQDIFDEQIVKMFGLIDQQLQIVLNSHPRESISYLIMSGGLCSSPYVQQCARQRYERGGSLRLPNVNNLRVLVAQEPQLAVVHGLVMSRAQTLRSGSDVFKARCCPVSYGVLCRVPYDPTVHHADETRVDDYEKKTWAINQVSWMIQKGDIVETDQGVRQKFHLKIPYRKEGIDPHRSAIIMSDLPRGQLPHSLNRGGASRVCQMEFTPAMSDIKLKNRHWYNFGPKYYRAEFEVRTLPGTGLKFQVWGKNGLMSKDHDDIDVRWQPVGESDAAAMAQQKRVAAEDAVYIPPLQR